MSRAVVFAVLALCAATALLNCKSLGLGAGEQAEIDKTASAIAECQARGQSCKADGGAGCYGVYDACMREKGLR